MQTLIYIRSEEKKQKEERKEKKDRGSSNQECGAWEGVPGTGQVTSGGRLHPGGWEGL